MVMDTRRASCSGAVERPNTPPICALIREVALGFMAMRERVVVTVTSLRGNEHEILGNVRQVSLDTLTLSLLREHGGGRHGVPLAWVRNVRKAPPRGSWGPES
jgi:hypothetical protein